MIGYLLYQAGNIMASGDMPQGVSQSCHDATSQHNINMMRQVSIISSIQVGEGMCNNYSYNTLITEL